MAVSLLNKYQKPSKHPQLKEKKKILVDIPTGMKVMDHPGEPTSILDYTQEWSELPDRGGLFHINTMTPGTDVKRLIMEQIVKSDSILLH